MLLRTMRTSMPRARTALIRKPKETLRSILACQFSTGGDTSHVSWKNYAGPSKFEFGFPTPGPQVLSPDQVLSSGSEAIFLDEAGFEAACTSTSYDYVVIGGSVCAYAFCDRVFENDPEARILVLERGPFFLPEHFQNLPTPMQYSISGQTYPWTMSLATQTAKQPVRYNTGMVPFLGGRTTLWSAWCPRPTDDQMDGWPIELREAAKRNFDTAEALLRVKYTDSFGPNSIYGPLQASIQSSLEEKKAPTVYQVNAAPLACDGRNVDDVDFQKYAATGDLLSLATRVNSDAAEGTKSSSKKKQPRMDIALECVVERILEQKGTATALDTSRGTLSLDGAKVVLAMGNLPPATLLRNSFEHSEWAGKIGRKFGAHFNSRFIAKIPREVVDPDGRLSGDQLGAFYVAGLANKSYEQQFHFDASAYFTENVAHSSAGKALRYAPDVAAGPSPEIMKAAQGDVLVILSGLAELDPTNSNNYFVKDPSNNDVTTNSTLQILMNDRDFETWNAMDKAAFHSIEQAIAKGSGKVQYWVNDKFQNDRPTSGQRRGEATCHESCVLFAGDDNDAPVDLNYKFKGSKNVYVTGAGLWPQPGSWNPTLTMVAVAQDLADKLAK